MTDVLIGWALGFGVFLFGFGLYWYGRIFQQTQDRKECEHQRELERIRREGA